MARQYPGRTGRFNGDNRVYSAADAR